MNSEKSSGSPTHFWGALALLAALIALWTLGLGPGGRNTCCHQNDATAVGAVVSKPIQPITVAPAPPALAVVPEPAVPIVPRVAEPVAAVVAAAPAITPALPAPNVTKLYFKVNDPNLRDDATELISPALSYLQAQANSNVRLQGFHDPVGELAHNQALANARAENVKALLVRLGIDAGRISIDQPSDMTGDGSRPKARRVEVTVTP
jgi:OmpA-OmpF porin, OOP family